MLLAENPYMSSRLIVHRDARLASVACGIALSFSIACNDTSRGAELSSAMQRALDGSVVRDARMEKEVRSFYGNDPSPAWIATRSQMKAVEALGVLRRVCEHGLSASDYDEPELTAALQELSQPRGDDRDDRLARLDVRITAALLAAGRDIALGINQQDNTKRPESKKFARTPPDFPALLRETAATDLSRWLELVEPPHQEYAALRRALGNLRAEAEKGGWPHVPSTMLRPGHTDPAVAVLRQRLAGGGYAKPASGSDPAAYDRDVEDGVRAFQQSHGLPASGIADERTIAAMNIPLRERIRQVVLNMERWRSMPDDFGRRHLFVNLPSFHLEAREDGKTTFRMRVIVGKVDRQTPAFSSEMTTVVFSPYWNIPESIVEGETVPAMARDPKFLTRNQIEILRPSRSGSSPVDPADIDWDDPAEVRRLAFRQRPGPGNALGHVKFLFPNQYDVYLHDTPTDHLFARPVRAFSHGCVRVEEPERFARYILKDRPEWDDARIRTAMQSGVEKQVKLNEPIPVHLVYFTSWVDEHGGLQFRPDIYSRDRRVGSGTAAVQ